MASSVISSVQLPDPSEQGLFNTNQRPRQRNYRQLSGNYTYDSVSFLKRFAPLISFLYSSFSFGNPETASYHFGVLVDPLSEAAQKWSVYLEVSTSQDYPSYPEYNTCGVSGSQHCQQSMPKSI